MGGTYNTTPRRWSHLAADAYDWWSRMIPMVTFSAFAMASCKLSSSFSLFEGARERTGKKKKEVRLPMDTHEHLGAHIWTALDNYGQI